MAKMYGQIKHEYEDCARADKPFHSPLKLVVAMPYSMRLLGSEREMLLGKEFPPAVYEREAYIERALANLKTKEGLEVVEIDWEQGKIAVKEHLPRAIFYALDDPAFENKVETFPTYPGAYRT